MLIVFDKHKKKNSESCSVYPSFSLPAELSKCGWSERNYKKTEKFSV